MKGAALQWGAGSGLCPKAYWHVDEPGPELPMLQLVDAPL